jgi:hypothetical protein
VAAGRQALVEHSSCGVRLILDICMAASFVWVRLCCRRDTLARVHLSAEIEMRPGVLRPIAWACEQPVNADGSISIDVKSMDDPKWRKGIR